MDSKVFWTNQKENRVKFGLIKEVNFITISLKDS